MQLGETDVWYELVRSGPEVTESLKVLANMARGADCLAQAWNLPISTAQEWRTAIQAFIYLLFFRGRLSVEEGWGLWLGLSLVSEFRVSYFSGSSELAADGIQRRQGDLIATAEPRAPG